jgi:hypothetical protein
MYLHSHYLIIGMSYEMSKFHFFEETYRPIKRSEADQMISETEPHRSAYGTVRGRESTKIRDNEKYFMTSSARVSFVGTNAELQAELSNL